jgi:putative addiction module component (TIGR02574 family)
MKTTLLSEAKDLPVAERLKLVEAIWDSIADSPEQLGLTAAQVVELDRRLAEYEKSPEVGSSWETVKERILKRS